MATDLAALDEAVRRFPRAILAYRAGVELAKQMGYSGCVIIEKGEWVYAIRREYRLIVAERAKQRSRGHAA